jgi:hypothetical protein
MSRVSTAGYQNVFLLAVFLHSMKLSVLVRCILLLCLLKSYSSFSQDSLSIKLQGKLVSFSGPSRDRAGYRIYPYNKKRVTLVTIGNIVGYGGTLIALNSLWYKDYPHSSFHFFDDNAEWLQVDKVGHAYSAYLESVYSHELWRWAGLPRKKRIWIGGLSGLAYQSIIEVLDGFSSQWGFSWGDFGANVFGSGMFISQQLAWDEQRIKFKFSFHRNDYGDAVLNARADMLYGKHETERFIKDYNGQTYWWSMDIRSMVPKAKVPRWLAVAVGYGAEGMFGARSNVWLDKTGNTIDRSDIQRYRQWYLAPDIDLSKIRTNKRWLRLTLNALNILKFPAPSLEFSNGSFKGHWIHF